MSDNQMVVPKLAAPVYTFVIPESARQYPTDPHKITLRAYSMAQEADARRVQRATGNLLDYCLLERALIKIDDKPVDQAQDILGSWSPKCRMFGQMAIGKVGSPDDDEAAAFLASMSVEAG